ncbi:hypothetical protein [Nocardia vermiculata]|uniref:Uncharacterized protein n=1 Tax=Nocardia vermiculata TaxID=257274 RepID=A0A846Y7P6_9NOCA|nr:hypothetical protein [Nocardia vermiculata]NKY53892.1 hypothetical protein [Nocardia vermiculata]
MSTHSLAPAVAASIIDAHAPELALLAEIGAAPHIVATGGGCHAIEFDATPSGSLYLLLTTEDHQLATSRAEIQSWCLSIYDRAEDDAWKTWAEADTFRAAYRAVWRAYFTADHIE